MVLMNSAHSRWPDHMVFCCCDYQDHRRAKNVLVPIKCDTSFLDMRTSKTCSTCYEEVTEQSSRFNIAHYCALCHELMCDPCFQLVKLKRDERIEHIQMQNKRHPNHWCTRLNPRRELTAEEMTSWRVGKCFRRHKTFDMIEVEKMTPENTYPYDTLYNCYSKADQRARESNQDRGQDGYKRRRRG